MQVTSMLSWNVCPGQVTGVSRGQDGGTALNAPSLRYSDAKCEIIVVSSCSCLLVCTSSDTLPCVYCTAFTFCGSI